MNKLKLLWFLLVPIGWWLAFELVKWVQFYPVNCSGEENFGICSFLIMTGFFGSIALIASSIFLAIRLQD